MSIPPDIADDEFVEAMVEGVGVGTAMYDESGRFLYVNEAYAALFDVEPETLVGTALWEVNPRFERARFDEYWHSFAEGETRVVETSHEYGGQRVAVSIATTRTRVAGTVYHVGTVRDISRRRERERQLEQLHGVMRDLLQADSSDEIADITARTAATILDYEQNIVRFADGGSLRPVAVSEQAAAALGDRPAYPVDGDTPAVRAYRTSEPVLVEDARELDDDYDRADVRSVLYVPIGDRGVLSIVAAGDRSFDQTDEYVASILAANTATALDRLADERSLEHQNERFEAFYDVISHDIPNHLSVAQTRLELAQKQESFDQLDHVSTAHERIQTVIDDMKTLVEQGQQIDETEQVPLSGVARRSWDSCHPDESATLEVEDNSATADDSETADDTTIEASRTRLKQLFENLFWNALEHAGDDVTVWVGTTDRGFYVEDDGPGIPADQREEVLVPGYTTADHHSGFGLAIVREIARAHDWTLSITDSREGGARFEFSGVQVE
jgi:PAS domain S-box-containing protein